MFIPQKRGPPSMSVDFEGHLVCFQEVCPFIPPGAHPGPGQHVFKATMQKKGGGVSAGHHFINVLGGKGKTVRKIDKS